MNKTLITLICLLTLGLASAKATTFKEASKLVQEQYKNYLITEGYLYSDENPTEAVDYNEIESISLLCDDGNTYDYIELYSGDTEHGPLYSPGTLNLAGRNSDGDFALYSTDTKEMTWLNCNKVATYNEYTCYPETGDGNEVLKVVLHSTGTASLLVNNKPLKAVNDVPITTDGDINDYGEVVLTIEASDNKLITLTRDYDELILNIRELALGLSDDTYMCE